VLGTWIKRLGRLAVPEPMFFVMDLDIVSNLMMKMSARTSLIDLFVGASLSPNMHSPFSRVVVELADKPHLRERGLMFRHELEDGHGMAFVFDRPDRHSFWGMNTFLPLDVVFVNPSGKIVTVGRIKPHDLTSVAASEPCNLAVELPDGWLSKNGFRVGDECYLSREENPPCCIFSRSYKIAQKMPLTSLKPEIVDPEKVFQPFEGEIAASIPPPQADKVPVDRVEITTDPARSGADSAISTSIPIPNFSGVGDAVRWSVVNRQSMLVEYLTEGGKMISREIEPHDMHFSQASRRQVVVSWDTTVGEPRNYLLNRIVRFSFPSRTFTRKFVVT
jgi:uncharacterized membrane protein (UPF0127 family)